MFNKQPSDRYHHALDLHAQAHQNGLIRHRDEHNSRRFPGEKTFEGEELKHVVSEIQFFANTLRCKHLLDFGCGKAMAYRKGIRVNDVPYRTMYDVVGIDPASVFLYDPGLPEYSMAPRDDQTFDLVVCTDVMEHIPEEDTDMVLDYLFEKCNKAMVLSISCRSAMSVFDSGENAHVNVQRPEWWMDKLKARIDSKGIHIHAMLAADDPETGEGKVHIFKSV